jgi:hypothetical protein
MDTQGGCKTYMTSPHNKYKNSHRQDLNLSYLFRFHTTHIQNRTASFNAHYSTEVESYRSENSSVSTVTRLCAGRQGFDSQQGRIILFATKPSFLSSTNRGLFPPR